MKYLLDGNNLALSFFGDLAHRLGFERFRENLVVVLRYRLRIREHDTVEVYFDGGDLRAFEYDEGLLVRYVRNADDAIVARIEEGTRAAAVTDDRLLRHRVRKAGGRAIANEAFVKRFNLGSGILADPPPLASGGDAEPFSPRDFGIREDGKIDLDEILGGDSD
ncbi:MAG: hypothetical protein DRP90_03900 [Planctomycetota bacterium]|nr:MAG: hypothetical protein DRP90_03900 [Planctomycetota bacterium]